MESIMALLGPIVMLMLVVLSVIVAILYFLLPFAIFGIKPILTTLNRNLIQQNRLIREQNELLTDQELEEQE